MSSRVKPLDFISRGQRGLIQPAVKCRGREYLRIIYGLEYTLSKNLERLRARAGIEDLRPYDLRHTFATRLVERNIQTIVISELLGHTQPLQGFGQASRITPGFAHATYEAMRRAVDSLEHPPQITAFEQKSSKNRANGSEIDDKNQMVKAG
jgi:PNKP (polynucleotide 5'-kinase/3'-phosphatase) family adenylyltransferase-like protein/integrase-like protein